MVAASLGVWDYIVFSGILVFSMGVGIVQYLVGGRKTTPAEYLYGSRKLHVIPTAVSMIVSSVSPITLQGTPAEVYLNGLQYLPFALAFVWTSMLCAWLFPPLFYPLRLTSVIEYFELRFNSKVIRVTVNIITVYSNLMWTGVLIYGPSTALEAISGVPTWASMFTIVTVSALYTTLGGIKAVIWVDVCQSVLMLIGLVIIVTMGSYHVGGMNRVWDLLEKGNRSDIIGSLEFDPTERQSFWLLSVAMGYIMMSVAPSQMAVQRYTGVDAMWKARVVILLFGAGVFLLTVLSAFAGAVVYAYYADQGCDPLKAGYLQNSNQLTPYFMLDALNAPGLPGLFLAAIFAAALSTVSSSQNSLAANVWEDILKGLPFFRHIKNETRILKILGVLFSLYPLSLVGGIFVASAISPWSSTKTVLLSIVIVTTFQVWITVGGFNLDRTYTPLSTSTENCSVVLHNATWTTIGNDDDDFGCCTTLASDVVHNTTNNNIKPSFSVGWFYSLSHLIQPTIAFIAVPVLSCLFALFPCLRHKQHVPNKYLFHIVRCCQDNSEEDMEIKETSLLPMSSHRIEDLDNIRNCATAPLSPGKEPCGNI